MRFELTTVVAVLASMCAADSMVVYTQCPLIGRCNSAMAAFATGFGSWQVDADEGCRGTGVPGMVEFCIDWGNARGHFRYDSQPFKRCIVKISDEEIDACLSELTCYLTTWEEVGCSWRQAPQPVSDTVSPAALPAPTTTLVSVPKRFNSPAV